MHACAAEPSAELKAAIEKDIGSMEEFKKQFKAAGATQFGSGWAWLVKGKDGKLAVTKTPNAENPLVFGQTPLLTMDVWEHAYYLDVQVHSPLLLLYISQVIIVPDLVDPSLPGASPVLGLLVFTEGMGSVGCSVHEKTLTCAPLCVAEQEARLH